MSGMSARWSGHAPGRDRAADAAEAREVIRATPRPGLARTRTSQLIFARHTDSVALVARWTGGAAAIEGTDGAPRREGADAHPASTAPLALKERCSACIDGGSCIEGTDAAPGIDGAPGMKEPMQAPGIDGAPGIEGIEGEPGIEGADGAPGVVPAAPCACGAKRVHAKISRDVSPAKVCHFHDNALLSSGIRRRNKRVRQVSRSFSHCRFCVKRALAGAAIGKKW